MNAPIYSDEVGGVDDLTAADLDSLGIEVQPASAPSKSYIRWKPIAEAAAKEAVFWKLTALAACLFAAICLAALAATVFGR